jgi:hypothetical protein
MYGTTGKIIKDGGKNLYLDNISLTGGLAASIVQADVYRYNLTVGPGGGSFYVDMSAYNNILIELSVPYLTLFLAGIISGEQVFLIIRNNSGSTATLTYPAWTQIGNAFPDTLPPGQTLQIKLVSTGTTVAGVLASCTVSSVFNIGDFGASPSATAATNTTAIQNAINAACSGVGGGAVYVPTGSFLTNTLTVSSAGKAIVIFGDGNCSILRAKQNTGLLVFTDSSGYAVFSVRNLRLMCDTACLALKFNCLPTATTHILNLVQINNISVGEGDAKWTGAIEAGNASNMLISNSVFEGGGQSLALGNTGLKLTSICVNTMVSNCNFNFWTYGVYCDVYQEGISFVNCLFIRNNYCGYYSVASSALRIVSIQYTSCNFDAGNGTYVLWCNNVQGLLCSNCYFLGGTGGSGALRLIQVQYSSITGSKFFSTGDYGITLEQSDPAVNDPDGNVLACNAVSITGNTFVGDAYSVIVGSLTMNTVVQNNTRATAYVTLDPGTGAVIYQSAKMIVRNLNTVDASGGVTRGNYIQP